MSGKKGILAACALLLAPCAPSLAGDRTDELSQAAQHGSIATFASLDRNADERVSRSEAGYDRVLSAIFADSDTDGDGFLTRVEYARATGAAPVNL